MRWGRRCVAWMALGILAGAACAQMYEAARGPSGPTQPTGPTAAQILEQQLAQALQQAIENPPKRNPPQTVETPKFIGMTLEEAYAANVVVGKDGTDTPIFATISVSGPREGTVAQQSPPVGSRVSPASKPPLTLTMTQPSTVTVPWLHLQTIDEATQRLGQSGLKLGDRSGLATAGTRPVIDTQDPLAGKQVPPGSSVNVVMVVDPKTQGQTVVTTTKPTPLTVKVPNLFHMTAGDAQSALKEKGLGEAIGSGPTSGVVVLQRPRAEAEVAPGTQVRLTFAGLEPPQPSEPPEPAYPSTPNHWPWYIAGALLAGAMGWILRGKMVLPTKPIMAPEPHPERAEIGTKAPPAVKWAMRLTDKPAPGVVVLQGEIKGERRGTS